MTRRRVAVITGSRSEFGLLQPVMEAIRGRPELELLGPLVTGMHADRRFGYSAAQVVSAFPLAKELPMENPGRSGADQARAIAQGIRGFTDCFEELRPELVVVLGDRAEPFAAAVAAAHLRTALAHIHGGDVSRCGIDDSVRHAITQLAHVHFPATPASAERIRRMGQAAWRVHVVGAPGLDALRAERIATPDEIEKRTGMDPSLPFLVILQHPDTTHSDTAAREIDALLTAAEKSGLAAAAIYPNSDPGHEAIVERLMAAARQRTIRVFPSIERPVFLGLLSRCVALVGNSSCGIIECPALGVPFVEVGTRQAGRERGANILSAKADASDILRQIERARDPAFRESIRGAPHPYGDGHAGEKIAKVLAELTIDERLLQKELDFP
ncbi:MAG: UDP-N-acetylglucosamine 2-epimerase (hydrolyzing) [Planctomycetes bacterium]|nr:UDP-N-acetylglucosamine 2-epimerase (hydrolyzing) [Planctomycetota bacterium]